MHVQCYNFFETPSSECLFPSEKYNKINKYSQYINRINKQLHIEMVDDGSSIV